MFDTEIYNQLPSIKAATDTLNDKLKSSHITLDALLLQLNPLFCEDDNKGKYAVWLLHNHFVLNEGERMVKSGSITEPTTSQSANIIAERWNEKGEEVEHVFVDNPAELPPPPSAEFLKKFRDIMDANKIDGLGVSYAPSEAELAEIATGRVFLEESWSQSRKQVVNAVAADDPLLMDRPVYESAWMMSGEWVLRCSHFCTAPICWVCPED